MDNVTVAGDTVLPGLLEGNVTTLLVPSASGAALALSLHTQPERIQLLLPWLVLSAGEQQGRQAIVRAHVAMAWVLQLPACPDPAIALTCCVCE